MGGDAGRGRKRRPQARVWLYLRRRLGLTHLPQGSAYAFYPPNSSVSAHTSFLYIYLCRCWALGPCVM